MIMVLPSVQVIHRRWMMTGTFGAFTYRFFTDGSELEVSQRGIQSVNEESIFVFLWEWVHYES